MSSSAPRTIAQSYANFVNRIVGAALAMLIVDLPGMEEVVLGPAIPSAWGRGSVKGLRLRGGGTVEFSWDGEGVVQKATAVGSGGSSLKIVNVKGDVLLVNV
jgi:alpha-L-fucosidase 2